MDGGYLNELNMKEIIENWMLTTTKNGSWKNYNDLHIDNINVEYRIKSKWIVGLLNCLNIAIEIRNERNLNFIVGIGLSLYSSITPRGLSFNSIEMLQDEIDWSPPSLYLFQPQWSDWQEIEKNGISVDCIDFGIYAEKKYLNEFYNKNDKEYRRSLFIVSLCQ